MSIASNWVSESGAAWTFWDSGEELARPRTEAELREAAALAWSRAGNDNAILDLVSPEEAVLSFGIAGDRACVNYVQPSRDPPYLKVVGDPNLPEDSEVVVFKYEKEWTEIPARNCVSPDAMWRIVVEFFRSGRLPNWVEWEEV